MRIAIILKQPGFLRYIQTQVEMLLERGHEVHIGVQDTPIKDEDNLLAELTERFSGLSVGHAVSRIDRWAKFASDLRGALDYCHYLFPAYRRATALKQRAHKQGGVLARAMSRGARLIGIGSSTALSALFLKLLRSIYASLPVDPDIRSYIRQLDPDLVLMTGLVWPRSAQADYVLACRRLGVKTGYIVNSWDNLTNKGNIKACPDAIYVWNEQQAKEARIMHGMRRDQIVVTGAPLFDRWFSRPIAEARADFCRRVGLADDKPYILYVGSSPGIAPGKTEVRFFEKWHAALRALPGFANVNVLVRPHPFNVAQWESCTVDDARLAIYPRHGRWVAKETDRDDYFHALAHCAVVVGINTSAMLEAALVGARTFTLQDETFAATQEGTVHFKYLTSLGIVESHSAFPPHFEALRTSLTAQGVPDGKRPPVPGVLPFVRPQGLQTASTTLAVDALEAQVTNRRRARRLGLPTWRPLLLGGLAIELMARRGNNAKKAKKRGKAPLKAAAPSQRVKALQKASPIQRVFEQAVFPLSLRAAMKFLPQRRGLLRNVLSTQLSPGELRRFAAVEDALARAAEGREPILVGPWISEVGFEVLYWIPFLRWAVAHYGIDRKRLVVISRGGVSDWYGGLASRYIDVFDLYTPAEFLEHNQERIREIGHQKQSKLSTFEQDLYAAAAAKLGLDKYNVLHPAAMFDLYTRFWKDITGFRLMERMSTFRAMSVSEQKIAEACAGLPKRYVAVKFYFRESLRDTPKNRETIARILRQLSEHIDVVMLSTDIKVDDHHDFTAERSARIHCVDPMQDPAKNLALQTAIIAGSEYFVGTYGGMTYVANYLGKTSFCFEEEADFNRPMHTELAMRKLRQFGGRLYLLHVEDAPMLAAMFEKDPSTASDASLDHRAGASTRVG